MVSHEEVAKIISDIQYKDWNKELMYWDLVDLYLFRWVWNDEGETQQSRWWVIDRTQPHSDIVRTALASVLMAEEHEARERFRYKGKKIFNPHYDVDRLAEISGKLENLEIPQSA